MKMSLSTITETEIKENAIKESEETGIPIMYLHNNGDRNSHWELSIVVPWFENDIVD